MQLRADGRSSSCLTRSIPVVVLSADATKRQAGRMLARGAQAYLTKPIGVRPLLGALDDFLA